MAKKYCI